MLLTTVRKNFALALPYLVEQVTHGDLGFALSGISIAYGFSKIHRGFGIGSLESARFPARRFDSGGGSDVIYGLCGDRVLQDVCTVVPLRLVPGMGWAAVVVLWCTGGRRKNGGIVSVWNCTNVGGGIPPLLFCWDGLVNGWHAALYARFLRHSGGTVRLCDVRYPQSVVPPIEEYKMIIRRL